MKAETKTGINELPLEEGEKKGKAEKKAGKRIGYNYIIVKSLKEHKKNDVVKCLYIKSLTKFGFCVIKEGTFGDSRDKHGRDIKDRLLWQKELHEQLYKKLRLPKYLGSFEENGNYYLVIELIKGKSLGTLVRKAGSELRNSLINGDKTGREYINYLIQIAALLEKLHVEEIVHRDATCGNFIITGTGRVAMIDMELSYSLRRSFPDPPFELGTPGFMSPQQMENLLLPGKPDDVFAFGAILLQVWTGISPSKLTRPPDGELESRVKFFIPDSGLAELVIKCLQYDPMLRPTIGEVKAFLIAYKKAHSKNRQASTTSPKLPAIERVHEIVQQGIHTINSSLLADKEKGWFAQNQQTAKDDRSKIDKEYFVSFQFGVSGPLYFLAKAMNSGFDISGAMTNVEKSLKLIEKKYIRREEVAPGLYYGAGGVAIALQTAIHHGLISSSYNEWIDLLLKNISNDPGLINGRAGQGIALLGCLTDNRMETATRRLLQDVAFITEVIKPEGYWSVIYEKKLKAYPGLLFGNAGTLYFLLEYAKFSKDAATLEIAEKGLLWLIKKSVTEKGKVKWKSPSGHSIGYGLAEGASGIAMVFLKAWEVTGKQAYRNYAVEALMSIPAELTDNNFTQDIGLAGIGEVYLEAFKVLNDEQWKNRAGWIVQLLLNTSIYHDKYGRYWLADQERHPIAGFMIGNSGLLHFLMRYCYPENNSFPLLDPAFANLSVAEPEKIIKQLHSTTI